MTRKRSVEADAERLEEEVPSAEADSDRRLARKPKVKGDHNDSEVENTVMTELWRQNDDTDNEIDLLICQQRDQYVASVHETGADKPVCETTQDTFPI